MPFNFYFHNKKWNINHVFPLSWFPGTSQIIKYTSTTLSVNHHNTCEIIGVWRVASSAFMHEFFFCLKISNLNFLFHGICVLLWVKSIQLVSHALEMYCFIPYLDCHIKQNKINV